MSAIKKTLNPAQKKAVESLTQDTFISAGAGTGKTTVLVNRFIEIIKKDIPLSRILAVTFTEKAAMEMRERLYAAIQTLSETESKYLNLLYQFDTAQITTIHGFCSQLLKENAIEAGLDPKFRILEETESELLKEEVIDTLFNEKISTEDSELKEKWLTFFETFDPQKIKAALFKIYGQLQSLGKNSKLIEKAPVLPLEKIKNQLIEIAADYKTTAQTDEQTKATKERLDAIDEAINTHLEDLEKIKMPRIAGSETLKEIYKDFCSTLKKLKQIAYETKQLPARELFYELLHDFEQKFYFEKRGQGLLDFDDLQVKTLELLSSKKIKTNLFDYIMIDETQDTSAIQFEIFNKLKNKNNLFFVGDHKQSIYGFRYAEPEQFLKLSQKSDFARIDLQENYRSHKPVIDFVNEVFTLFWEKSHGYEPLGHGLTQTNESNAPQIAIFTEKEVSKISTLRKKEALWVGQQILERLNLGIPEKEMVILFRTLNHAPIFENVLKNLNIRYQLIKGKGFFDQLEIRDLLSVLKLLQNPTLELELLSVLRSPFFGISDENLYTLKKRASKDHLLESAYQMFPGFKKVFEPLYHAQNEMTLSGLLNQFIQNTNYEAVSLGKFQGMRRLSNIRKLLEAVTVFEENHGRNLTALAGYLDHLQKKDLRENTPDVPDTDEETEIDQGSVKLMTVHAAKGLEFNTVFYCAIDSNPRGIESQVFIYDGKKTMTIQGGYFEEEIKERQAEKELAEAKRIFYVASTRAKEKLFLTGGYKLRKSKNKDEENEGKNVLSWLMDLYPEVKNAIEAGEPGHFNLKHFSLTLPEPGSLAGLSRQKQINLNEKLQLTSVSEEIKLWSAPIKQLASQTLSATEYTLLPYCARAFQLKVGFNAESFPTPIEDDFELTEEALQSSDEYLGRRVHEFIKNISSSDSVLKIKQRIEREVEMMSAHGGPASGSQKLFKKCLEVFLSSVYAVWISHQNNNRNTLWREKKFMVSLDRHLLQGIIDYAYLNNDNQWIVVDFKTSVIHSPAHRQWLRAHYFGQLQAYSYALEKLTPYPVKEAKLVFLSDHHCEEVFSREELLLESLTGQSLEKGFVEKPEKNLKHCEFCYLKGVCKP